MESLLTSKGRSWLPCYGDLQTVIMHESYKSKYSIHPRFRQDVPKYEGKLLLVAHIEKARRSPLYVSKMFDRVLKSRPKHQGHQALLVQPKIPEWKETDPMEKLASIYLKEVSDGWFLFCAIICDRDSRFASNFWRSLQNALGKVGEVAYKLELPEELSRVHNTFHVSNLKKCYADEPLAVPLDGLHFDDKLQFVEEPVEIMDREVKRLKLIGISLV
ncbi:hypothetical protein Tco_1320431 [Tanacetum coccineum]